MEFLFILITFIVTAIATFAITKLKSQQESQQVKQDKAVIESELMQIKEDLTKKSEELEGLRQENIFKDRQIIELNNQLIKIQAEQDSYKQQKEEMLQLQKKMQIEFENIAGKILKENSKDLAELGQKNLQQVLSPFKSKVEDFQKQVANAYEKEMRDKISLKEEVKKLFDLNQKISKDAVNLTNALKGDNKQQGNWGELVLEKVLEKSGLRAGEEYEVQDSTENDEGARIQPDIVIYLPEDKHVVIDSKLSLIAYDAYVNADDAEVRDEAMRALLQSVKTHIRGLADKKYHSSKKHNSLDFVLMFIPIEACYMQVLQHDADLFWDAWQRKIMLVSPTTLHSTLRIIASLWKQARQAKNAAEIARQGGALYDKFIGFLQDMEKIRKGLDVADDSYRQALNKLQYGKGNLIDRAQNIKKLGAKTNKELPKDMLISIDKEEEGEAA